MFLNCGKYFTIYCADINSSQCAASAFKKTGLRKRDSFFSLSWFGKLKWTIATFTIWVSSKNECKFDDYDNPETNYKSILSNVSLITSV